MLFPVILSGGSGTRLWPVSRASFPKQFVPLIDPERSLLQMAAARLDRLSIDRADWIIVANEDHRFLIAEQLKQMQAKVECLILEPCARNTAPAVALAAIAALARDPNARLLVQTADHVIPDLDHFAQAVEQAVASDEPLITFGVTPTRPETGYGYLELGEPIGGTGLHCVRQFVEKPDLARAQQYLASGQFLWNSGMFILDAKAYLDALAEFCPEILSACQSAMAGAVVDFDFCRIDAEAFAACPADSIDYAVMERAEGVSVLPFTSEWSDLGAWDAVLDQLPTDEQGNAVVGDGLLEGSTNTLIRAERRLVAALGVDDLLIVETPDVVLVSKKSAAQDVKRVVDRLRALRRSEADTHVIGYRPWGTYESIAQGDRFQVKKIVVKPGKSLSLQMHHHRAEHWIVVQGTAEVVNGETTLLLQENQSTFIPLGVKHRLTNPGKLDLVLIEVQSGGYLGEDDIVRFEDHFGRV